MRKGENNRVGSFARNKEDDALQVLEAAQLL